MKRGIFIVDDHPLIREGLTRLINQEADLAVVGDAADAATALQQIAQVKPDVAIVDISLGGGSGIELTKDLAAAFPTIRVLILSMYDESLCLERALRAGAKGYVMKQEATEHIIAAIRAVLTDSIYINEKWKNRLAQQCISGAGRLGSAPLSEREEQVLQLVGQGYATRKIASTLFVSVKTIESHYANIKTKLALNNLHKLIQHAVQCAMTER